MRADLVRRAPHYCHDWYSAFDIKVIAAVLFMFFTSIGPAVTFANLLVGKTNSEIGVVEVLSSSALCGIIFSFFGGQPLVILGVTGPVSIFSISVYTISDVLGLKFLPFFAWCQIWSALMHFFIASANMCSAVRLVTRFSCEIFGCLIALLYLYNGIVQILDTFGENDNPTLDSPLLQLAITAGTVWFSMQLAAARSWTVMNEFWRNQVADFGPALILIVFSGVPYLGENHEVDIERLPVPESFSTTSGRGWFVDLSDIPLWGVFVAILPGLVLTILFFFDHNVSSLLAQAPEMKLKKGDAYHWDFFVVGACVLITGLLGIPPTNGLIPQAPLHVKALSIRESYFDEHGCRFERVVGVHEQRVSNFLQAFLCGLMCFQPFLDILAKIPVAVLSGLFLYMGIASFDGNQLFERITLIVSEDTLRRSEHAFFGTDGVDFAIIKKFTGIQAVCCAIIFIIAVIPKSAIVFPMLIAILVPLRLKYFPRWFSADDLELLDPIDAAKSSEVKDVAKETSPDQTEIAVLESVDTGNVVEVTM
jgi:hypothetical protein